MIIFGNSLDNFRELFLTEHKKTDEAITPDNEFILYHNRFEVTTLDLNKEFSVISRQLDSIVYKYLLG